MKTNGKYIIQVTGPIVTYRLDILAKVCPEARHFLLVLTNKFSYDLYKEYHDFYEFVIMDDYRKVNMDMFDLDTFCYDYLVKNLNNSNANSANIKLLVEKYILDTVYGKGRMDNKFNLKHKGTPAQKVAMLERINKQMHSPNNWGPNGFNWNMLNDPDFYNMKGISWYGYENGYSESLNNRINKYKRQMNKKN